MGGIQITDEITQLDIGCVWLDLPDQKVLVTSLTPFTIREDLSLSYSEHYEPSIMLEKLRRAKSLIDKSYDLYVNGEL